MVFHRATLAIADGPTFVGTTGQSGATVLGLPSTGQAQIWLKRTSITLLSLNRNGVLVA
ncbi:hypothetical protein HBB04_05285 (plasmid) [Pseudomonas coronafaciens]|nr:hypothetical protein HBB04_05285 [Pseudomonas coronafaciens]